MVNKCGISHGASRHKSSSRTAGSSSRTAGSSTDPTPAPGQQQQRCQEPAKSVRHPRTAPWPRASDLALGGRPSSASASASASKPSDVTGWEPEHHRRLLKVSGSVHQMPGSQAPPSNSAAACVNGDKLQRRAWRLTLRGDRILFGCAELGLVKGVSAESRFRRSKAPSQGWPHGAARVRRSSLGRSGLATAAASRRLRIGSHWAPGEAHGPGSTLERRTVAKLSSSLGEGCRHVDGGQWQRPRFSVPTSARTHDYS
ncbi:hypothetical protein PMIN01_00986 [Paraphaeosphaeria minitans]|uniref:Uncharacterized protein n=1 Tax=Paraphaeosphaeria minitans TaxID=565426 RepID=A0A9P6GTA7_9PLEO|nr:hypothetical protein PMIN01_00986 [Paraphaeosphaeria minitans]